MQDAETVPFMLSALPAVAARVAKNTSENMRENLEQEAQSIQGAGFEPNDTAEKTIVRSQTLLKEKPKVQLPPLYKVMLLNDDYTPMEFVVGILQALFQRSHQEAMTIMLHVHKKGVGICGCYPYDIAETKAAQVVGVARKNEHPLQCVIEKDEEE